jgi:hypothetical protein
LAIVAPGTRRPTGSELPFRLPCLEIDLDDRAAGVGNSSLVRLCVSLESAGSDPMDYGSVRVAFSRMMVGRVTMMYVVMV